MLHIKFSRPAYLTIAALLLCLIFPLLTWHFVPYGLLYLSGDCQAVTVNTLYRDESTIVVNARWWLHPGVSRGTGTYESRVDINDRNGAVKTYQESKSFVMDYAISGSVLNIHTRKIHPLSWENAASPDTNSFTDPAMTEGVNMDVHLFRLPDGQIMSGLNGRPRALCQR